MGLTEEEIAELRREHGGWLGSNPYFLMIATGGRSDMDRAVATIDLDEYGWIATNAELMRAVGQWYLVLKRGQIVVATMLVREGEQPYYVARHVGFAAAVDPNGPKGETTNYGIGKKRTDGTTERLWVMANGCIVLGDDIEHISLDLLKSGLL